MAYVLSDDTTYWNVERVISVDFITEPNDIIWDERFVVISEDNKLTFFPFEVFDRTHMDDISLVAGNIGEARKEEYLNQISGGLSTTDTGGFWLAGYQNGVYVTNSKSGYSSIDFYDIVNDTVDTISTPSGMNSNLLCCNNKLWMTKTSAGGDILYIYDILTQSWSSSIIPSREQQEIRHLSHDKNNHILITNFNDWSVCKYDVDGTFIETIYLDDSGINKEPAYSFTDTERNTFVLSFNGMISKIDTSTNSVEHFAYAGKTNHNYFEGFWGFESDGTHMWISTSGSVEISPSGTSTEGSALIRMKLSDKTIVGTDFGEPPQIPDMSYQVDDFEVGMDITKPTVGAVMENGYFLNKTWSPETWKKVIIMPEMTKQVWNGSDFETKTYQSHICVIHEEGMFAFPNSKLWRTNHVEVGAVGMVSSGTYDYTGD